MEGEVLSSNDASCIYVVRVDVPKSEMSCGEHGNCAT